MSMQTPAQIRAEKLSGIRSRLDEIKQRSATRQEAAASAREAAANTPRTAMQTYVASDGRQFDTEAALLAHEETIAAKQRRMNSAFNILPDEFRRYGFDDPEFFKQLEGLIRQDLSDAEINIKVRSLPAYERRFGAIKKRIAKGLNAISEAEFLQLEDQYSNVMRRFGLPESYYTKQTGRSAPTFESLIESDVSPVELEERLMLGQKRVLESPPEVLKTIKDYYGDSIKDGDVLAFVVDPKNALEKIRTKVTAAEIGAAARQAGLSTDVTRAEELGRFGVTGEQARQGFQTVAAIQPRGAQLAAIYGEAPLTQMEVESEVFGTTGATEARRRRERLTGREQAAFGGTSGVAQGALSRERAGQL